LVENASYCVAKCPTYYIETSAGSCVLVDSRGARFELSTIAETWEDNGVTLFQPGDSTPTIVKARGVWFDGIVDILEIKGLVMTHTMSLLFWAKPYENAKVVYGCFPNTILAINSGVLQFSHRSELAGILGQSTDKIVLNAW
jgi:hypothetical protein